MVETFESLLVKFLREKPDMRSYLVNKNLCLCYWLRSRIGKRQAFWVSHQIEKVILVFGRERI